MDALIDLDRLMQGLLVLLGLWVIGHAVPRLSMLSETTHRFAVIAMFGAVILGSLIAPFLPVPGAVLLLIGLVLHFETTRSLWRKPVPPPYTEKAFTGEAQDEVLH